MCVDRAARTAPASAVTGAGILTSVTRVRLPWIARKRARDLRLTR